MAASRGTDAMDVESPSAGASVVPDSSMVVAVNAGLSKKFESARDKVSKDKFDVVRHSFHFHKLV